MSAPTTGAARASQSHSPWRLLAWSVRRELWQHRSVIYGPAAMGVLFVAGALLTASHGREMIDQFAALDPARRAQMLTAPLVFAADVIRLVAFIVAVVYSLDALYSERRERHILFWKSLPVSDAVSVGAKAAIPLLVIPAVALAVIVGTHLLQLLIGTLAFAVHGASVASLWSDVQLFRMLPAIVAMIVFQTLWQAPIYGWLMLVSGWAPRVPVLWALLVPAGLVIVESAIFGTSWVSATLKARLTDGYANVMSKVDPIFRQDPSTFADVMTFVRSIELWAGLVVAALFFAGAVWRRRRAEPT